MAERLGILWQIEETTMSKSLRRVILALQAAGVESLPVETGDATTAQIGRASCRERV